MFDLNGQVAVITGGTGVLGQAMAAGLIDAGAQVVILGRNLAKAQATAQALGANAFAVEADILERPTLEQAAQTIQAKYGRIDILINAAGGNAPQATAIPPDRTFFDLLPDDLKGVFNLNLLGSILPAQAFGQIMAQQGRGVILNISSMAAYQPLTRVVAYAAAKAAINNFTQWLAVYMAHNHSPQIRVNAVAPGFFLTEQNQFLMKDEQGHLTPRGQTIMAHTPMGRFGEPDDLVGTVRWLCSDAARFVTGIVVPVDGGFSAFSGV